MNVSYFDNITQTKPVGALALNDVLAHIKTGYWAKPVEGFRQISEKLGKRSAPAKAAKQALPAFTVSGTFKRRAIDGLIEHSGYAAIDIDDIPADRFDKVWLQIKIDPYTYACFKSCSGKGICAIIKVDAAQHDKSLYQEFAEYYASRYGIEVDITPDVSRLRFVSSDPDLVQNSAAKAFYKGSEKPNEYRIERGMSADDDHARYEFAKGLVERKFTYADGQKHHYILDLAGLANRLGISENAFTSFVHADFPDWKAAHTNAIPWTYKNKAAAHGSFIFRSQPSTSPHSTVNGTAGHTSQAQPKTPEEEAEEAKEYLKNLLETRRADWSKPVPEPDPVLSIGGGTISTAGNITVITGHSKSGKSGVMGAVMAGCMASPSMQVDTLGIAVAHNKEQKAVIYIDTEQSRYNFDRNYRNVIRRCGLSEAPEFFQAYWLRGLGPREILHATQVLAAYCSEMFGGVHLFVIDGIGDYVKSVNDEEECNQIVEDFAVLAELHACPVLTVLHFNPGSQKERGHMGSQLQRKAESILTVKKSESEVSTLGYKELRNAGRLPEIDFEWSKEKNYHVLIGGVNLDAKQTAKLQKLMGIATRALLTNPLSSKDFIAFIMEDQLVKERRGKVILKEMKEAGIVDLRSDRLYHLVNTDPHTFDPNEVAPF